MEKISAPIHEVQGAERIRGKRISALIKPVGTGGQRDEHSIRGYLELF